MLRFFRVNSTFSDRLDDIDPESKDQLEMIVQGGNRAKLDWYFTDIPDLRCGIRPLDADRAKTVFLRIKITTPRKLSVLSYHISPDYGRSESLSAELPLDEETLELILAGFCILPEENLPPGKDRGFLPNEYFKNTSDTDRNLPMEESTDFDKRVQEAYNLDLAILDHYLRSIADFPAQKQVTQTVFERNAYVVASALRKANGICQSCRNPAPFKRRTTGLPYLEVHHIIPLSQGGKDTVENTVAICPNCHRKAHFG